MGRGVPQRGEIVIQQRFLLTTFIGCKRHDSGAWSLALYLPWVG